MLETVVVLLTGSGRGAVASLLLTGPQAQQWVEERFQPFQTKAFATWQKDKPYFGNWHGGGASEELIVCQTDRQQYEIHCHGGRIASRQIISSLVAYGAREISQEEWLQHNATDRFVAPALQLLSSASTERTAAIAMDQTRGALRQRLLQIRTWMESGEIEQAKQAVDRLVELGELGVRLQAPFSVVLVGKPNTGKSSLINAIVGYQRSLVFDQPGTTRDLVRVETAIDGWPIRLTDTAGVRDSLDQIEQEGIRLARETLKSADLAIVVVDLSSPEPATEFAFDSDAPRIRVGTKRDLLPNAVIRKELDIITSAETGEGVDELNALMATRLVPSKPTPGEAIPLSRETLDAVCAIQQLLADDDAATAMQSLEELLADGR